MEISYLIGDLAMGGASGWAVGYAAKKFFKLVAFIIGTYTASLLYLSSRGIISVQWEAVSSMGEGILSAIDGLSLSVGVLGIGAIGGFWWGFKSG